METSPFDVTPSTVDMETSLEVGDIPFTPSTEDWERTKTLASD
jgi:hypothetical protein